MAKKKDSKVSISSVDKILKRAGVGTVEVRELVIGEEAMAVEIKKVIPFSDFANMVAAAANAVFGVDENGAEIYNAEYEDAAKFMSMLIYVANFKSEMSADRAYDLLYCTDLNEMICSVWSEAQHAAFDEAFEKAVEMRRRAIIANAQSGLSRLLAELDKATSAMQASAHLMEEIDPDVLQAALNSMGNMDEEKLVDNVLKFRAGVEN